MRYKTGMYGGAFDPLHTGHLHALTEAAALCEDLYVILSWSEKRDRYPVYLRYRWLREATAHFPHVHLLLLEDTADTKESYTEEDWVNGAETVRKMIGKPIDFVVCGSDYRNSRIYERIYPEAEVRYIDRNEVPVSSTWIEHDIYRNWDNLAEPVRKHLVKKVLIAGTESTGKSTLTRNLSLLYNTSYVDEYGRKTCEDAGGEEFMIADDFYENILMQAVNMRNALKTANRVLFVDTDALTTAYYGKLLKIPEKDRIDNLASAVTAIMDWDLVLYLEPDVPFIQDGTRNETIKDCREEFNRKLKAEFISRNIPFVSISGDYEERLKKSKEKVNKLLNNEE